VDFNIPISALTHWVRALVLFGGEPARHAGEIDKGVAALPIIKGFSISSDKKSHREQSVFLCTVFFRTRFTFQAWRFLRKRGRTIQSYLRSLCFQAHIPRLWMAGCLPTPHSLHNLIHHKHIFDVLRENSLIIC
jgi:hypothetical protein